MTPTEITTHALALGITREKFPEFWDAKCPECGKTEHDPAGWYEPDTGGAGCNFLCCGDFEGPPQEWVCTLPDPLSDDPRACLWEPFYMRALGWPGIKRTQLRLAEPPIVYEVTNIDGRIYPTGNPTAALYAAWLAKEKP